LHIDELIPAIISLIPCNADAPLEADLCVRLLLYEETETSSSSAECLRFGMAEKITEEGRTGANGGKESSSLDSSLSFTSISFTGRVGGPIPLLAATIVLLFGVVNAEFAIAPRV